MSGAGKFSCELEMGREEGWEGVPSLWEEGTNKERRDGVAQTGGDNLLHYILMEDQSGKVVLSMRL